MTATDHFPLHFIYQRKWKQSEEIIHILSPLLPTYQHLYPQPPLSYLLPQMNDPCSYLKPTLWMYTRSHYCSSTQGHCSGSSSPFLHHECFLIYWIFPKSRTILQFILLFLPLKTKQKIKKIRASLDSTSMTATDHFPLPFISFLQGGL